MNAITISIISRSYPFPRTRPTACPLTLDRPIPDSGWLAENQRIPTSVTTALNSLCGGSMIYLHMSSRVPYVQHTPVACASGRSLLLAVGTDLYSLSNMATVADHATWYSSNKGEMGSMVVGTNVASEMDKEVLRRGSNSSPTSQLFLAATTPSLLLRREYCLVNGFIISLPPLHCSSLLPTPQPR